MKTLEELLETEAIPQVFSDTVLKLSGALSDNECGIDDVVDIIKYDQAVTARVLRYANSSVSSSRRDINSLREAVIRLGGGRILEWLMAECLQGVLNRPLVKYGFKENELWRHSIAAASAAESLHEMFGSRIEMVTFTSALLHDIGKLLLANSLPDDICLLLWKIEEGKPFEEVEKELFGFTHADIGAALLERWNLPSDIVHVVKHHHDSDQLQISDCSLKVADILAHLIGEGLGYSGLCMAVSEKPCVRLGIKREHLERLLASTRYRFENVIRSFES